VAIFAKGGVLSPFILSTLHILEKRFGVRGFQCYPRKKIRKTIRKNHVILRLLLSSPPEKTVIFLSEHAFLREAEWIFHCENAFFAAKMNF